MLVAIVQVTNDSRGEERIAEGAAIRRPAEDGQERGEENDRADQRDDAAATATAVVSTDDAAAPSTWV